METYRARLGAQLPQAAPSADAAPSRQAERRRPAGLRQVMAEADAIFATGTRNRGRSAASSGIHTNDEEYLSWVKLGKQEEHTDVLSYWSVSCTTY